jgi:ParB/RepB/Spo0J family partition protein
MRKHFDSAAMVNLATALNEAPQEGERVVTIDPKRTRDNPYQPRQQRNHAADDELAASIESQGVTQPVVVLPADEEGIYTIVARHRTASERRSIGAHGYR